MMSHRVEKFVQSLMKVTPFQLRRRLPTATLEPLQLILALYKARGKETNIVQVGAWDGVSFDPIHDYVAEGQCRAILIEPNPTSFARLQKTYAGVPNLTLLQVAVGLQDGEAHLFRSKRFVETDLDQGLTPGIASFDPRHLIRHGEKAKDIERISVPCRCLSSLVADFNFPMIDLLQIDAEGFDAEVVRMALRLPELPACIHFEHKHLKKADRQSLFESLEANQYRLGYDAWNILAVQAPLMERLKYNWH
jgi:FkbM family methyltransferase